MTAQQDVGPYRADPSVRVALFDIDGTLTTGGGVWELLIKSPEVRSWRRVWMYAAGLSHYGLSRARILSQSGFRDHWVRLMAFLMTGWTAQQAQALVERIMREYLVPALRPDVVDILRQHKGSGHTVLLVSSMFAEITQALARHVGADVGLGSRLGMQDGRCAGRIEGPTCTGAKKLEFVRAYLANHTPGVSLGDCAAYADSRADISFLAGAGYPVAVYPEAGMRQVALERGWKIYPGS